MPFRKGATIPLNGLKMFNLFKLLFHTHIFCGRIQLGTFPYLFLHIAGTEKFHKKKQAYSGENP